MRFVSTRGQASAASLGTALFDGLAPDGGLYVPDSIEEWSADEIADLTSRSLPELGLRVLSQAVLRHELIQLRRAVVVALKSMHARTRECCTEKRILTCTLRDSSPTRIARNIDHRSEGPTQSDVRVLRIFAE